MTRLWLAAYLVGMNVSDSASHPYLDLNPKVSWSALTPDRIEPDLKQGLEDAQAAIDAIADLADDANAELTLDNTLLALDRATEALSVGWTKVNHLDSVNNNESLRKAINAMLPQVSEFYARIPLNEKLWTVIRRFSESDAAANLDGPPRRLLQETLADFRAQGADLPPEKKARLEKLEAELAQKTQKFSENELDSTNAWELIIDDESRLDGLPESAREQARQNALSKGHGSEDDPRWRFTLHAPSFLPVLKYARDEALRKTIWEGLNTVGNTGDTDNSGLIWEILALRQEKAGLIGKPQFGDLVLERRMAKTGPAALKFVEDLFARTKPFFDEEAESLRAWKEAKTGESGLLKPWEVAYYAEMRQQEEFDFDEEALRPYFPIERVISGLFELSSQVFGLKIEAIPSVWIDPATGEGQPADAPSDAMETWHPDVRTYDLFDESGTLLGTFYADWHPRESKRSGAWFNYILTGNRAPGTERTPHLGLICGNLTPSTGGKPALLTHREVETIFHEFGHLLHHLCGEVEIKSLNGVNVAWDFVELPSQIMENWCWERQSLDLFARHYQTGDPIPEELFQKMLKTRNYMAASAMMRQLSLGKLDLELHLKYADPKKRPEHAESDLDGFIDSFLEPYLFPVSERGPSIIRRFGHLFSGATGYAAGYYSYKWAEVLEADAFSRFKNEGILNGDTGRDFRLKILSKGNSVEPGVLFHEFMGRDPDPEALLVRSGLVAS